MSAKVKFSVSYGFYNDFLNGIIYSDMSVYSVKPSEYGFTAVCYAHDYPAIARLARKYQCRTRIISKKGLYFALRPYRKRKGIAVGAVLFMLLCYIFSCVIWDIEINTTDLQLKNTLAHSLYNMGVYRGNTCTKDQLTDVQRQLMLENENLGYITLNFYKGILTCEVYRRQERKDEKESYTSADIVCLMDGVVTDIRVYRGFSAIQPGQSVSRGDALVCCTELDSRGRLSYSQTAAYIAGDCEKEYTVFIPFDKTVPVYTGITAVEKTVSFLGKDFTLEKADLSGFDSYTSQQVITPGNYAGFCLPFTVKTVTYSRLEQRQLSRDFPTARKAAEKRLAQLIVNDIKLEKEYSRRYDYRLEADGVTAVCRVQGRYVMI